MQRERVAVEQQVEGAEGVFGAGLEHFRQVGFEIGARARARAVVVEAPDAAVGQDSPANPSVRDAVRGGEVAQHLAVRRGGPDPADAVAGVEADAEPLALANHGGVAESVVAAFSGGGARLGVGVGEQQQIGNVLVASRALLRQVVNPSQQLQDGMDQLLLGGGFGRVLEAAEGLIASAHAVLERGERFRPRGNGVPLGRGLDAVGQEVLGEELAGHIGSSAIHADIGLIQGLHGPPAAFSPV